MRKRLDTRRVILLRPRRRRCCFFQAAVADSVVYRVPAEAQYARPEWLLVAFFQPCFFSTHAPSFSPHPTLSLCRKTYALQFVDGHSRRVYEHVQVCADERLRHLCL